MSTATSTLPTAGADRPSVPARFAVAVIAAISVVSLSGFIFADWWIVDLFVHFRIQYLVIALLAGLYAFVIKHRFMAVLAFISIVANAIPVYAYLQPQPADPNVVNTTGRPLRIAAANIFIRNENFDAIAQVINDHAADVVVMVEASGALRRALENLVTGYPYRWAAGVGSRAGTLILSKHPIDSKRLANGLRPGQPLITITAGRSPVQIVPIHASWPVRPAGAIARNREQRALAAFTRHQSVATLAIGDFNNTPFSNSFQTMLTNGKLRRAAAGFGWMPTWPSFFAPAGIQIDHLLVNERINVHQMRTESGFGSDHRFIVADLTVH